MAYELKTKQTDADVEAFLNAVPNERRREDGFAMLKLMEEVTGEEAKMWGPTIVGFGTYHYKYASGHEGDMAVTGFSPRKANLAIYITPGSEKFGDLLARLGKHKFGKSCLYVNKLSDVDEDVLRELIRQSVAEVHRTYPNS